MPKIEFYPKKTKLLIVVKSIDGGTGTYVLQLLQMKRVDIVVCVLEKPSIFIDDEYLINNGKYTIN